MTVFNENIRHKCTTTLFYAVYCNLAVLLFNIIAHYAVIVSVTMIEYYQIVKYYRIAKKGV